MLKFFTGAFEGGSSVQPIVLSYPFRYFNSPAFLGNTGEHLLKVRRRTPVTLPTPCLHHAYTMSAPCLHHVYILPTTPLQYLDTPP